MRHNRETHRLGRNLSERKALLESLVASLLRSQQIHTTLPKAKAAKRLADRVIHLGKKDTLASRRRVFSFLQDHDMTSKLFKEVAPRFRNRSGGYTRILHLNRRKGDGAEMALLELTEKEVLVKETKAKPKKAQPSKHAGHEPHIPKAETGEIHEKPRAPKETPTPPREVPRQEKPGKGFFRNIARFFRNKGGS